MKCAQPCAEHDAGYLSKQILQEDKMMHVLLRIKVPPPQFNKQLSYFLDNFNQDDAPTKFKGHESAAQYVCLCSSQENHGLGSLFLCSMPSTVPSTKLDKGDGILVKFTSFTLLPKID